MCDFVLRATSRIQGIDSLKSSLQKELDTLKSQTREHARYISSLESANKKLETTIKSLQNQISALQKEPVKPKDVEDKTNADVKKEKSSSVWMALFFFVLAVFIFIGLRLQEVPSQQTRSLPAPARIQDSAKEASGNNEKNPAGLLAILFCYWKTAQYLLFHIFKDTLEAVAFCEQCFKVRSFAEIRY